MRNALLGDDTRQSSTVNDIHHAIVPDVRQPVARTRGLEDWLLIFLAGEKSVQHAFVTYAFASDSFNFREEVAPPYQILLAIGAISAVLFAVASGGAWRQRSWAPYLLIGLALVDIIGEFVAQGTVMIQIVLSFIVGWVVLVLAWRALRRAELRESLDVASD
jgi:hypothetical protein